MAMLECYEPSLVAWWILSRTADAFMTAEDDDVIEAMKRLADPVAGMRGNGSGSAPMHRSSW